MASFELNIKAMSLADLEEAVASLHQRFQATTPEAMASVASLAKGDGPAPGTGKKRSPRAGSGAGGLLTDVSTAALEAAAREASAGQGGADQRQEEGGVGSAADGTADSGAVRSEAAAEGATAGAGAAQETGAPAAAGTPEEAAQEESPAAEAPAQGAEGPAAEAGAPAHDIEAVKLAARALSAARGVAAVQTVMGQIPVGGATGAKKFAEIPEAKFGQVIDVMTRAAKETLTAAQIAEALA